MTLHFRSSAILKKLVDFDFAKKYTIKVRIVSHICMWLFFAALLFLNYNLGYNFEPLSALLLSLRMTISNAVVFYLFFYLIVPNTLNRGHFFVFIFSFPVIILVWLLLNHYIYVVIYRSNIKIDLGILDELIRKNYEKNLLEIISPRNVLAHLFEIIMAIAPFFFIKLFFDLTRLYSQSVNYTKKIAHLKNENLKIENKFLLKQLNPHFLFNTMNSLYALAIKKDNRTSDVIVKLSEIMRYTLYDADADFISLEKELEFTTNYFEMESMRYPREFSITKSISVNDYNNLKIRPLIFFVFIENAFKYGLKSQKPFLHLTIKLVNNNLYFAIENDKLDSPLNKDLKANKIGGLGLKNIERRLQLIYSNRYKLDITNSENLYRIELNIEL